MGAHGKFREHYTSEEANIEEIQYTDSEKIIMNDNMKFTLFSSQLNDMTISKDTKQSTHLLTPGPNSSKKTRNSRVSVTQQLIFQDKMAKLIEDC